MDRTISLHAVDLAAALSTWRKTSLDMVIARAPRGRIAALVSGPLGGVTVDRAKPAEIALAAVPTEERRGAFDALIEDLAVASLWDIPHAVLAEALSACARVAKKTELSLGNLDGAAASAYPPELGGDGLRLWLVDPVLREAAAAAARQVLELPDGAFPAEDPSLVRDILDGLAPVLEAAARPSLTLVAQRQ